VSVWDEIQYAHIRNMNWIHGVVSSVLGPGGSCARHFVIVAVIVLIRGSIFAGTIPPLASVLCHRLRTADE
jgi:hypothetical protein